VEHVINEWICNQAEKKVSGFEKLYVCFETTVESYAIAKNNIEVSCVPFTKLPSVETHGTNCSIRSQSGC
jgi:hypothetical protein